VSATDKIQCKVDNANMEEVIARSHFRDRLWSPLVLFHHVNPLSKKGHQAGRAINPYIMARTAIGTRHKHIPGIRGGSAINKD
jgi:hypothetical protein